MAKLQIPIEDELMFAAKMFAFQNGTTLKEVVTLALKSHINYGESKQPEPTPIVEEHKPTAEEVFFGESVVEQLKTVHDPLVKEFLKEEPKPSDYYPNPLEQEYDYILRKTAKTGKPEKHYQQYQSGPIFWMTPEGCKGHFDEDGNRIPFRYTDEKGKVVEPDDDEMAELIEAYGSNIKVEE